MSKVAPEGELPDLEAGGGPAKATSKLADDLKVVNVDGSDSVDGSNALTASTAAPSLSVDSATADNTPSAVLKQPLSIDPSASPRLRTPTGGTTPGGSARPSSPLAPSTPLHVAVLQGEAAANAAKLKVEPLDRRMQTN
jgi:hypothetical protein